MEFKLSNLSIVNGARYVEFPQEDESIIKKLIITVHITSKIVECPYEGKFEQVDYNVDLDLPDDKLPSELNIILPTIAQEWINTNYPKI